MFIKPNPFDGGSLLVETWIPRIARQHICFIEEPTPKIEEPEPEPKVEPKVEPTAEELAALEEAKKLETKPEPVKPATVPAWQVAAMQKRIDKLTAQLKAKEPATPDPNNPASQVPADEVEARAEVLATAKAQQAEFDRACTETVEAGRKEFPDFNDKVQDLLQVRDISDPASVQAYNTLIAAAIETGDGAKIIHKLGGDLEEAARIMGLTPVKMGVALAKLASVAVKIEPDVSTAPKPITPLNGGKKASFEQIEPDDPERAGKLDMSTWMERREKQVAERGLR